MVSCKHCSTQNSLDSTFCKRCGTSLSEEAIKEAQAKLDTLLEQGNAFFNEGRTDEAMAVAESAALSNPSSAAALSLMALCHERRGQIAEALECAERIVELNPDSELDKIKRNALRTRLQSDLRVPTSAPNRGLALVGAFSAVVLVVCIGILLAKFTSKSGETVANRQPELPVGDAVTNGGTVVPPPTNLTTPTPQGSGETNQGTGQPNTNPAANPGDVQAVTSNQGGTRRTSMGEGEMLPGPEGDPEVRPFSVPQGTTIVPDQGTGQNTTRKSGSPPDSRQVDEDPPVEPPKPTPQPTPVADEGHIEINVRNGSGAPVRTGNTEPAGANGLETMMRVGTQQFQLGNYAGAAKLYEQALRAGGDAVTINQRLGQAYSQMGRSGEAIQAYKNCITAADSAISTGRGNKTRLATVKETAEQALKVLQGG